MVDERILVSTTDGLPGRQTGAVLGLVWGHYVLTQDLRQHVQDLIETAGRTWVYEELLEAAREEAVREMLRKAEAMGANAVLAVRLNTSPVIGRGVEVLAYGTAAVVE